MSKKWFKGELKKHYKLEDFLQIDGIPWAQELKLHYSRHAQERKDERIKTVPWEDLPETLRITERNLKQVRVEVGTGKVQSVLVHIPYDHSWDLYLSIADWKTVTTVYLKEKWRTVKSVDKDRSASTASGISPGRPSNEHPSTEEHERKHLQRRQLWERFMQ